jgi:HPr kinase/phosphorylase
VTASAFGSDTPTVPGTLVQVCGVGILITGPSGVGKSEAALGLIARGHRLVADDAVALTVVGKSLQGSSPAALAGMLGLRDLGVIDVARMYGTTALAPAALVDYVFELVPPAAPAVLLRARLEEDTILGVRVCKLRIGAPAGRDLPLVIETAVRDLALRAHGHHADEVLAARQRLQSTGGGA